MPSALRRMCVFVCGTGRPESRLTGLNVPVGDLRELLLTACCWGSPDLFNTRKSEGQSVPLTAPELPNCLICSSTWASSSYLLQHWLLCFNLLSHSFLDQGIGILEAMLGWAAWTKFSWRVLSHAVPLIILTPKSMLKWHECIRDSSKNCQKIPNPKFIWAHVSLHLCWK